MGLSGEGHAAAGMRDSTGLRTPGDANSVAGAHPGHEEWLTRGQMADINCVSKKTLLVYQEKGLLIPDRVDEETGYRYYSWEQCSQLDMIRQLQGIGVSLAEIGQIVEGRSIDVLERYVERQAEELRRQAREIEIARRTAAHFLDSCHVMRERPECEVPRLVWLPRQRIIFFPVEPYPFEPYQSDDNTRLRRWEKRLRAIKRQFVSRGLPMALFHNIGCVVGWDSLASRNFVCTGGFIPNEEGFGDGEPEFWEAGYHLTATIDTAFYEGGRHAEHYWLTRLLDIADDNGFTVTGDYRCDILAETPAFLYEGRDMAMRLWVPVDIGDAHPPFRGVEPGVPDELRTSCGARAHPEE